MKRNLFILLISLIILNINNATTVNGRFNVLTNDGSIYVVKLQINTDTGTDDMGGATIVFNFNNSDLSIPISSGVLVNPSAYTFHNFSGGNYSTATITKPLSNQLWLNIELLINNSGTVVAQSPSWTDVVTITFTTLNSSGSSDLAWQTGNSNWKIFDGDNAISWTTGSFTNENTTPLPVELSSFTASTNQNAINLKWQTKTEVNNYGFDVERKLGNGKLDVGSWDKIGFVSGHGNSNSPKDYSLTDKNPSGGSKFVYRLKQIDNDGKFEYSKEVEIELVPNEFALYQNYPNPFNPVTNIKFALQKSGIVNLTVYNMLGEQVAALINEVKEAGFYDVQFDASNFSTGVYIFRLTAGDFVQTKKMTLMK